MSWLEGFILGIIQGIGEPIPVSSSAQTMVASFFMNVETPRILFEVFLNFASFSAILWLTRKDVYQIMKGSYMYCFQKKKQYQIEFRMAIYVVIGTIPAILFGFTMKEMIDSYLSNMTTIGLALIITGVFLFLVRKMEGKRGEIFIRGESS